MKLIASALGIGHAMGDEVTSAATQGSGVFSTKHAVAWIGVIAAFSSATVAIAMWGVNTSERNTASESFQAAQVVRDDQQDRRMTRIEDRILQAIQGLRHDLEKGQSLTEDRCDKGSE